MPGDKEHFLINPYGLHYGEITASNLVKMDVDGNIVEESEYTVNPAGIVIHTAIHSARSDVCIAHIILILEWRLRAKKKDLDTIISTLLSNKEELLIMILKASVYG